jgi:hypothetical protein
MNMILSQKADAVFPSLAEWLERVGENPSSLFEIGELKRSRESDIRGNSNPETLWLLLQTIATILYRDEWQSAKEAWDKMPDQFYRYPGNSRRKSTGHSQAYCYDAFAFLRRLKDKGTIKQEEYDGAHREFQKTLERRDEDPCSGEIVVF